MEEFKKTQDKMAKTLEEQGRQLNDLQRQVSKRSLIIHGPDVPRKAYNETESQTIEIFRTIANEVFGVMVERLEVAACHRQGKVIRGFIPLAVCLIFYDQNSF